MSTTYDPFKTLRVAFIVTQHVDEQLDILQDALRMSRSEIVRRAVDAFAAQQVKKMPKPLADQWRRLPGHVAPFSRKRMGRPRDAR